MPPIPPSKYSNAFGNASPPAGKVPQEEVNKFCAAAKDGDGEAVKRKLKEYGPAILNRVDNMGDTALTWSAWMGHLHVVQILLDAGADIDARGMTNRTALGWAAQGARKGVIQLLLDRGADASLKDINGKTPLQLAQESPNPDTAAVFTEFDRTRGRLAQTKSEAEAARAKSEAAIDTLKKQKPNFKLK
jgi:ankyrin repeat protein